MSQADGDRCSRPIRADDDRHSWRFDGDDPYVVCRGCDELRTALSGRVIRPGHEAGAGERL